jgi:hypothetical protein
MRQAQNKSDLSRSYLLKNTGLAVSAGIDMTANSIKEASGLCLVTGKYRDSITSECDTPYTNGTDLGGND